MSKARGRWWRISGKECTCQYFDFAWDGNGTKRDALPCKKKANWVWTGRCGCGSEGRIAALCDEHLAQSVRDGHGAVVAAPRKA